MADSSMTDAGPSCAKKMAFLPFVENERHNRGPILHSHDSSPATSSVATTDAVRTPRFEREKEDNRYRLNEQDVADDDEINKAAIEKLLREDNPFNLRRRDSLQGLGSPRELESRDHVSHEYGSGGQECHGHKALTRQRSRHPFEHQLSETPSHHEARWQLEPRHQPEASPPLRHESSRQAEFHFYEPIGPRETRHGLEDPRELGLSSGRVESRRPAQQVLEPSPRRDFQSPQYTDRGVSPFSDAGLPSSPRGMHGLLPDRTSVQARTRNNRGRQQKETDTNVARKTNSKRDRDEDWQDTQEMPAAKRRDANKDKSKPHEPKTDVKLCEFSSPCRMNPSPDGMHWRKVVSHIFGRNKASTKLFPDAVWVHYCRKHYQRARYRADQWPFTQCDLILESLYRMEQWDGVQTFELTLRRREQDRDAGHVSSRNPPPRYLQSGRRHPTAVTAPVPDWLRDELGKNKTFEDIRRIVEQVREYMVEMRREEKAQQERRIAVAGPPRRDPGSAIGSGPSSEPDRGQRSSLSSAPRSGQRKGPGNGSSNAATKGSVQPPRDYYRHGGWQSVVPPKGAASKYPSTAQMSRVRFPDVEILPTFYPWVWEDDNLRRAEERANRYRDFHPEPLIVERMEAGAREAADREDQVRAEAAFEQMEEEQRARSESGSFDQYRNGIVASEERRRRRSNGLVTRVSYRGAVKKPGRE